MYKKPWTYPGLYFKTIDNLKFSCKIKTTLS